MFEDTIIVQSALSAFNNAALVAPAFLWSAVLTLPIYICIWLFCDVIMAKFGWSRESVVKHASFWTAIITFGWVVLYGGNYGVLRDDTSSLPFMIAAIIFVTSLFIGSHLHGVHIFKRTNVPYIVLVIIALALSDMHVWWGPLLQIGAAMAGFLMGRFASAEMRDIPGIILIIMATTIAILMQPEFFRFGQLGNLTWVHMLALLLIGATVAVTIATRNVPSSNKIHESAYIKLKWMMRFLVMLGVAIFVMTESVPAFLGFVVLVFFLIAMSVWHCGRVPANLGARLYALTILLFGIITTMPVITAVGILCLANLSIGGLWSDVKRLL